MLWKNWKKIDFVIFDPKKSWSRLRLGWISGKPVKIVKKWLNYLVLEMFLDILKKFCDHSMILWEMAGDLPNNGLNQPPPMSFRVKSIILNYLMYNESLLIIILTRFDCSCRKKSLSNSVQLFSLSWVAVSGLIDFMSKGHASWNWLSAWKNMVLILWKVSFQTCLLNPDSISNLFYIICIFYTTRSHKSINIHNYFETCHFILTAKLFYNLPRL